MKAAYALYTEPGSAQRALDSLRAASAQLRLTPRQITVITAQPFDAYDFGRGVEEGDHKTVMPWLAALGGIIGGATGFWLPAVTESAYPLPTSGMPIVSLWTNGIITYEMTMLGAILTTLVTLGISARLPNPRTKLYDPEVADGKILVGVINPTETARPTVEQILREAGAGDVRRFPPSA